MSNALATPGFLTLPDFIMNNLGWWIFGAIVVVGLLLIGLGDVARFSMRRVWALSSVSFAESIRRKVLWITPLAILGVIIIAQLQKPVDAQDAIRQTTKIALFATGMLVAMVSIILACTNLPKEIDNRVIYTIVTKPTTRLEIVLGKVLGFARVSAAILLIMGLFTWAYLHVRAWSLEGALRGELAAGRVDPVNRPLFEHYVEAGLINAKAIRQPTELNIYSRVPQPEERIRWAAGHAKQQIMIPFRLSPSDVLPPGEQRPSPMGLIMLVELHYQQRPLTDDEMQQFNLYQPEVELEAAPLGPLLPGEVEEQPGPRFDETLRRPQPMALVQVMSRDGFHIVGTQDIGEGGRPLPVPPSGQELQVPLTQQQVVEIQNELARTGEIYLQIIGMTPGVEYGIPDEPLVTNLPAPAVLLVPGTDRIALPSGPAQFLGRHLRHGQQLSGGDPADHPVAIYAFRNARVGRSAGEVPMELQRVGVEKGDVDLYEGYDATYLTLQVHNRQTGELSEPLRIAPEPNRTAYFTVPAGTVSGGDFDVLIRNISDGHFVGLWPGSLVLVAENQSFAFNLFKSLAILWLMSLLIIIVSIFTSTFVSWPIAVVLTAVILTGHWGVERLGEEGTGIGPRVASELGFDPAPARVVSETVEALNRFLNFMGAILPDISRFAAVDDIERGISIPAQRLVDAGRVAFGFGIPLMVLAYIFLRNKEVAP
jgi:hypothetical protein